MSTLEKVIKVVAAETGAEAIDSETRLDSLGLDSLEFVCLMQAIQNEVANVPDEQWAGMETVEDIADACNCIIDPAYGIGWRRTNEVSG